MNKVILVGHVGQDPEYKTFPTGNTVCNFSLATNKRYKGKDGQKKQDTTWHYCQAWNKTAELCNTWVKKGSFLLVEGEINVSQYETEQGEKRTNTRIIVFNVQFLDKKEELVKANSKQEQEQQQKMPFVNKVEANKNYTADDIPF